ncbi:MAG: NAD(P)H-dependent oxidoreductase [Deltaproteobacteria bacterium]|nr:NAD(P)H-dependent oxidoreductase [Deltaproteobacteria bacterium]
MNLLALSGSSSSRSINHALLLSALTLLPEDVEVTVVSVRDLDAPLFSVDIEKDPGPPASILALHATLNAADAVLIASPEHNGSMPAMLKNTIDWLSRVVPFQPFLTKPLALLGTSPGGRGAATNLNNMARLAPFWGATVVGTFSLPSFGANFDTESGQLTQAEHREALTTLLTTLLTP